MYGYMILGIGGFGASQHSYTTHTTPLPRENRTFWTNVAPYAIAGRSPHGHVRPNKSAFVHCVGQTWHWGGRSRSQEGSFSRGPPR